MSYRKNTAGQKFNVLAISTATGLPITGDAANITAQISLDSGTFAAVTDTNPTELDATNAPGVYVFDLTQAETNGDVLTIIPSSTTANVQLDMLNIYTVVLNDYKADVSGLATAISLGIVDGKCSSILTDTGTTIPAQITGVETKVDGVKATTDQFVFTVANQVDANCLTGGLTQSEVANAVWDASLASHNTAGSTGKALKQLKEGTISADGDVNDASATASTFITTLTQTADGFYHDKVIVFVQGSLLGQARHIEDYNGTTKSVTVSEPFSSAPADGDEFLILAGHEHSTGEIANAVWSESQSGYNTPGTFGYYLDARVSEAGGTAIAGLLSAEIVSQDYLGIEIVTQDYEGTLVQ